MRPVCGTGVREANGVASMNRYFLAISGDQGHFRNKNLIIINYFYHIKKL